MTIPSKRQSTSRSRRRRSHQALEPAKLTVCQNCKGVKAPHRVCPHCGFYAGRDKLNLSDKLKKKTAVKKTA